MCYNTITESNQINTLHFSLYLVLLLMSFYLKVWWEITSTLCKDRIVHLVSRLISSVPGEGRRCLDQ